MGIHFSFIGLLVLSVHASVLLMFSFRCTYYLFWDTFSFANSFMIWAAFFLFGDAIFIYATPVLVHKCAALTS